MTTIIAVAWLLIGQGGCAQALSDSGASEVCLAEQQLQKADAALKSIPVIAVTSYALSGDEEKARNAGCDDYIAKPYSPRQMLAKVREIIG